MKINNEGKYEIRVWGSLAQIHEHSDRQPSLGLVAFDSIGELAAFLKKTHMDNLHGDLTGFVPLDWMIDDWARLKTKELLLFAGRA